MHKTQGSEIYVLDTTVSPPQVLKMSDVTGLDGLGGQASQIDKTTFDERSFRRKISGLIDPGAANMPSFLDISDEAQNWLHENAGGAIFPWAIGLEDGFGIEPTVNGSADGFDLSASRSWITFDASVSQDTLSFPLDGLIALNSGLQLDTKPVWTPKTV